MIFDEQQRSRLAGLADVLIPAGSDMPSAGQADVAGKWLDAVLAARPDLVDPLTRVLETAGTGDAAGVVRALHDDDPTLFGVLTEIVAGAYFMNPDVRQAVGYAGQEPRAMDPRADYMEDGLLESVIRRGPIYRPTPNTAR